MFSNPKKNAEEFGFMSGQTIVDLGSGAGHYALILSKTVGVNGRIYCVDINQDMLVRLKNQAERQGSGNIEVIWGDAGKLNGTKLRDDLADGVVLSNTLSLIDNKPDAILEAKRITKQGGKICVIEWVDLPAGKVGKIKQDNLRDMFMEAGLNFEKVFDAGEKHYGLIFKK